MKSKEFITELKLATSQVGNLTIEFDHHLLDQRHLRKVYYPFILRIVQRLPKVEDQILELEIGQQFWVYSEALDVGLGFRKMGDANRIRLMTTVDNRPFDGPNPIIEV